VIRRGRERQVEAATTRLRELREAFAEAELDWRRAVMLASRGIVGDLDHALSSHAHIHMAEGEAVRDAMRQALDALAIPRVDQDEKSVPVASAEVLGCADADALMKTLRPAHARKWAREERLVALAAWLGRRT